MKKQEDLRKSIGYNERQNFCTIHQNNYFKCLYISDHLDPCSQQRYDKIFLNTKVHDNQYEAETISSGFW